MYKQQRNKFTSLKRKCIKEFCSKATSNAKHPGQFWQNMKPLLPNSSLSKQNSVTLVEDGKVLTKPSEVVEGFNNHFASVAVPETHRGSVENFSDYPSVLGIASRKVLEHPFTFEPVSHLSQNLSGFLQNHSCCTALLKMTEDWRRNLDNRESTMAVAVDLSKAFDSISLEFDVILSTGS